ncbi:hypothetical protein C8Q73DRAFT_835422 [Cubamyces lactineus]|nr:hypothetical protein C8Q73DRAFT_835422 [Cubamyces lactineus]
MDPLEFQELRSCFSAANTRSRTQVVPTDFWLDVVLGLDAGTRSRFSKLVMEGGWQSDSNVASTLRKIQSGQSDSELEVEDDLLGTLAAQILEKFRVVKPPSVSESHAARTTTIESVPAAAMQSDSQTIARSHEDALGHTHTSMKRGACTSHDDDGPSKRLKISSHLRDASLGYGTWESPHAPLAMRDDKGTRLSSVALTLNKAAVTFWYMDPCGVVVSATGLCLLNNFADFAAAVIALKRLETSGQEVVPGLFLPDGKSTRDLVLAGTLQGCSFDIPGDSAADRMQHRVTFGECIYSQGAVVGRRTVVYTGQAEPQFDGRGPAECIAVKLSYQVTSRTAEHELIARAHEKNVPHIPTVYGHRDLFDLESLQDGIRARVVKHCGAFYNYENRVARIIVVKMYTPLLQRLRKQPLNLIRMVKHISEGLHHLRHDALILHRDVSMSNIMCDETGGRANFILTDFDLAVMLNDDGLPKGPTGKHHTGTLPFMAERLVEDLALHPDRPRVLHELHHDYESLYWVALWCTMKADYDKQEAEFQKRIDQFLTQWELAEGHPRSQASETSDASRDSNDQPETMSTTTISKLNLLAIAQTKFILLHHGRIGDAYPPTTERFQHAGISELLNSFRFLIANAYVRDSFVAAALHRTGFADGPREAGAAKAEEGTKAGATKADDDDLWTQSEDEDVDEAYIGMPMRDIITRDAIKQVVRKAKKAALTAKKVALSQPRV